MALFPVLDLEGSVQINDPTRFDASKSFVTKGALAISTMTIKVGDDGTAISVFDATVSNRYLDFGVDTFKIDVDATNKYIDFQESGAVLVATLTVGTYTLSSLCTEMKTKLELVGDLTYTVTVSAKNEITIAATGNFSLYPLTGANAASSLLNYIGFKPLMTGIDAADEQSGAATYTGDIIDRLPRNVTLTIGDSTSPTPNTATKIKQIAILTVSGDALFSSDQELLQHEPDILKWCPKGRYSFLNVHRRSQELILAWLDEQGYVDIYGDKFDKFDIVSVDEVKQWSIFMTLKLIFEGISNAVDDVFAQKAERYQKLEELHRNRAILRIDTNRDGKADLTEGIGIQESLVVRR